MRADDVRAFFDSVDAEPTAMFADELLARLRVEYQRGRGTNLEPGQRMAEEVLLEIPNDAPSSYVSQPPRPRRSRRRIAIGVAVAASLIVAVGVYLRSTDDDGVVSVGHSAPQASGEGVEEAQGGEAAVLRTASPRPWAGDGRERPPRAWAGPPGATRAARRS